MRYRSSTFILIIIVLIVSFVLAGCSFTNISEVSKKAYDDYKIEPLKLNRTSLSMLPAFDPYSDKKLQVDLRSYDLTTLQLNKKLEDLIHANFDTKTKWPYWLPEDFDPKKIMEYGKNPGLGIAKLHKQGITGKGVSVAIIDDVLLPGHTEYSQSLKYYEQASKSRNEATISGSQQASVLVGKSSGIAPDADLYYIAETHLTAEPLKSEDTGTISYRMLIYQPLISAIDKVVEMNLSLDKDKRIRVIAIGGDIPEDDPGHLKVEEAIRSAQSHGIFVISSLLYETSDYYMDFNGLGRNPMSDPELLSSYGPGQNWAVDFFTFGRPTRTKDGLLVPMDSRCTASPTGENDYAFYPDNSKNLCIPYLAGLYTLACQVYPDITPEIFWKIAVETSDTSIISKNSIDYKLKNIVNPSRLIERIKTLK